MSRLKLVFKTSIIQWEIVKTLADLHVEGSQLLANTQISQIHLLENKGAMNYYKAGDFRKFKTNDTYQIKILNPFMIGVSISKSISGGRTLKPGQFFIEYQLR